MEFKITSRKDIYKYSLGEHHTKTMVISVTDKFSPASKIIIDPERNGIHSVLRLKFNDVAFGSEHCITKSDAQEIADFIKDHEHEDFDMIIVHCEVGISRSAGICAAIMKYYGEDYEKIFNSKKYKPNMGCFCMVCGALDVSCLDSDIERLSNINKSVWKNRNGFDKIATVCRIIKRTNLSHSVRQIKIKSAEKRRK